MNTYMDPFVVSPVSLSVYRFKSVELVQEPLNLSQFKPNFLNPEF